MKRKNLLERAASITNGDRQKNYGTPENNFANIANYWTLYLGKHIDAVDVAQMMILMKLARLKADKTHEDSWIDIAGYAACGSEIVNG